MSTPKDLQNIILWCRKNGVAWDSLTVGAITINGSDMKLAESLPKSKDEHKTKDDIVTRYGGDLLKHAAESPGMSSVVEMDD